MFARPLAKYLKHLPAAAAPPAAQQRRETGRVEWKNKCLFGTEFLPQLFTFFCFRFLLSPLSAVRFSPVKADTSVTLYWIRSNREGSDNAAIESTSLDPNYR